jgi:2-(1,2-epoxy-1,2-dihydrophenyl)acetyl-CoA isomerase
MTASVLRERHGATLVIRLNKPEARNAFDLEMRQGIAEAVYEARDTAEVRAVVITGTGSAFCAGGDLKSLSSPTATASGVCTSGSANWSTSRSR